MCMCLIEKKRWGVSCHKQRLMMEKIKWRLLITHMMYDGSII